MNAMRSYRGAVHNGTIRNIMDYERGIKRENGLQPQPEPKAESKGSVRGNA